MLGDLSAKYESNGNPGLISSGKGDPGGKSYGCYQLSSKAGSLQDFIRWADRHYPWIGTTIRHSPDIDSGWRECARLDRPEFAAAQWHILKRGTMIRQRAVLHRRGSMRKSTVTLCGMSYGVEPYNMGPAA